MVLYVSDLESKNQSACCSQDEQIMTLIRSLHGWLGSMGRNVGSLACGQARANFGAAAARAVAAFEKVLADCSSIGAVGAAAAKLLAELLAMIAGTVIAAAARAAAWDVLLPQWVCVLRTLLCNLHKPRLAELIAIGRGMD